MSLTKELGKELNQLLEKNYDAEKGYKDAAERVKNPQMKSFLQEQAQKRYDFGHQIKTEIKNFGQEPDKGGSLKGTAHRSWMDLKAALSSDKEEEVMEEVQRGEQASLEEYNEALKKNEWPASTQQILTQQRDQIQQAQQSAKNFEHIS